MFSAVVNFAVKFFRKMRSLKIQEANFVVHTQTDRDRDVTHKQALHRYAITNEQYRPKSFVLFHLNSVMAFCVIFSLCFVIDISSNQHDFHRLRLHH